MTTRQKRRFVDTSSVKIDTPTAIMRPSNVEQLLGAQFQQDMRWVEHILDTDNSLVQALNLVISLQQGWAIPGSAHQYYTQYYTGQNMMSNTNTNTIPNLNTQSKLGTAQPQPI